MVVAPGTRIVGRVEWISDTGRAGVVPAYNDFGAGWLVADPNDYPTRGQITWRKQNWSVDRGLVVLFEAAENRGEDLIEAKAPQYLCPVVHYPDFTYDEALERLIAGRFPAGPEVSAGKDIYVWCKGDLLLGPLTPKIDGDTYLVPSDSVRFEQVAYRENENAIFRFPGDLAFCAPTSPITGYFDCRPDADILRTAVRDAVGVSDKSTLGTPEFLATRALMQKAADSLRDGDSIADRQYKYDRIHRALKICGDSEEVRRHAAELSALLFEDPAVRNDLERRKAEHLADAFVAAKDEVLAKLKDEQGRLERMREESVALANEKVEHAAELDRLRSELESTETAVSGQLADLEHTVTERVTDLVDDASGLLAESVLLRALGVGASTQAPAIPAAAAPLLAWSPGWRTSPVIEARPLNESLVSVGRESGIDHSVLQRIHAAVVAELLPVLTGNGATAALTAYATAVCAGRIAALPVAHDFLHPVDLLGVRAADPRATRMHAGLLSGVSDAVREGGTALLVLEAFNRAPTESYLMPWLQVPDRGIAVPMTAQQILGSERIVPHPSLLVAATAAAGRTTAPVSPDLWGFAVAIDVPRRSCGKVNVDTRTSSPEGAFGAKAAVESLEDAVAGYWPIDDGVLDTARRFASALDLVGESDRIPTALAECILVPALSTSMGGHDLELAVNAVLDWSRTSDPKERRRLYSLAQRFHSRFA